MFEMLRQRLINAERSYDIALRRCQIARTKFINRQISLTDLNIATQEKVEVKIMERRRPVADAGCARSCFSRGAGHTPD